MYKFNAHLSTSFA